MFGSPAATELYSMCHPAGAHVVHTVFLNVCRKARDLKASRAVKCFAVLLHVIC